MTVFGELQITQSVGCTTDAKSCYVTLTVLCYASGMCVHFVDTKQLNQLRGTSDAQNPPPEGSSHDLPSISADGFVTALAAHAPSSVVAYSDNQSTSVKVVTFPSLKPAAVDIQAHPDLRVVSLAFSRDGKYLVSLGSLPTHHICLWHWRRGTLLCKASNEDPASSICFDPMNSKLICALGDTGTVNLWSLQLGYKRYSLAQRQCTSSLVSKTSVLDELLQSKWRSHNAMQIQRAPLTSACWTPDSKLLCTTPDGNMVMQYDVKADAVGAVIVDRRSGSQKPTGDLRQGGDTEDEPVDHCEEKVGEGNLGAIALTKQFLIAGGNDATLRWLSMTGGMKVTKSVKLPTSHDGVGIARIQFSPNYSEIGVECSNGALYVYDLALGAVIPICDAHVGPVRGVSMFRTSPYVLTCGDDGTLRTWDTGRRWGLPRTLAIGSPLTAVAASPFCLLGAVGSQKGTVRLIGISEEGAGEVQMERDSSSGNHFRTLMRERLHKARVDKIVFDSTGTYLASISQDGTVALIDAKTFRPVGWTRVSGRISDVVFNFSETEKQKGLFLYLIGNSAEGKSESLLYRYRVLQDTPLGAGFGEGVGFAELTLFKSDCTLNSMAILPSHMSTGSYEAIYFACEDKKLRLYNLPPPPAGGNSGRPIDLGAPAQEYKGAQKPGSRIGLSSSNEMIIIWSADGKITLRDTVDPERGTTHIAVHGAASGGVLALTHSNDTRTLVSVGGDNTLCFLEWKYTIAGKKAAVLSSKAAKSVLIELADAFKDMDLRIASAKTVEDRPDSDADEALIEMRVQQTSADSDDSKKPESATSHIESRIQQIRERLTKIIQKNETLPAIEKLNRDDFIIDHEERARLLAEGDSKVKAVRAAIEEDNLKKRVIMNKIKKECWDSMETTGQLVKSFQNDPLTGKLIEVSNYPLRRRPESVLRRMERIKLLRIVQLMSEYETRSQKKKVAPSAAAPVASEEEAAEEIPQAGNGPPAMVATPEKPAEKVEQPASAAPHADMTYQELLHAPFDLTTSERRRTQTVILGEVVLQMKREFNGKVKDFVKAKSDEISKIEEKGDRIKAIMDELQVSEALFRPQLDDDEMPERIIEVRDEEVKVEKYVSEEERKRIEERRRQEEERLRASKEDDSKERGLMAMMSGRLEDRVVSEEKEELVKPDWMNKPKSELTEDERKLVKEFEKKLATQKEEQEKYRKALETELRKLQGSIQDICAAFDDRLREFFNVKLATDQLINQNELKIIKLCQAIAYSEDDETKEAGLLRRLDDLKAEKATCMIEIPEIKKDLERYRDEYELAMKRDKDLDRQFKKEFSAYDFFYEDLFKLFRRRTVDNKSANAHQVHVDLSLNPYPQDVAEEAARDQAVPEFDADVDMPEGLPAELWTKLVEMRQRKIQFESEVRSTSQSFAEMQALVSSVLEASERIRKETERVAAEYVDFMEYKFHNTYNVESLFGLKQGQVEVPQAPVVTDYSDALFIHRTVVEKLNDAIATLGAAKVDALKDIKEYRKGIHALEWENKMLDFQAEDLVIRTRDIQLLRVTKEMQDFIRGGDEQKHSAEIATLERRAEHSVKAHEHKIAEKLRAARKLKRKIMMKDEENRLLDVQLAELELAVAERAKIHEAQGAKHKVGSSPDTRLKAIAERSKLVDLAKAQQQDLTILREESERLRMRTFPAFPTGRQKGPGF